MPIDGAYWAGRTICVTGGTGFLGYHLVQRLLDLGAVVRVLALPPRPNHPLRLRSDVDFIAGEICDREQVRQALQGCSVVFHTAGCVSVWGPGLQRLWPVHVEGTRNVLETAPESARIVHTSSIMAIGAGRTAAPLDEVSPFNLGNLKLPYCHAKRAAEELALASGRDVVVTNPGYLLGPEDYEPSVLGRFCMRYWRGRLPLAPPGGINLVDVRDVADGHLLAAERGRAGRRYILGGENQTFAAFMRALALAAGFAPRVLPQLPYWVLAATAGLSELRAWFTGKEPYPALGHVRLNRFHWYYRSDRAATELGFQNRALTATIADTLRWFGERKPLKQRGLNRWWLHPQAA